MDTGAMTFYNHIENVRTMAINLTNGEPWRGAIDKTRVFDSLDASRREYMQLQEENAKLRELVDGLRYCANESHGRCSVRFIDYSVTCCPLYDVDSGTARCEALLRELGIETV